MKIEEFKTKLEELAIDAELDGGFFLWSKNGKWCYTGLLSDFDIFFECYMFLNIQQREMEKHIMDGHASLVNTISKRRLTNV